MCEVTYNSIFKFSNMKTCFLPQRERQNQEESQMALICIIWQTNRTKEQQLFWASVLRM